MSKQWKCSECVKHGTDACYNGSRFDDDNCKYVLIDSDYAYEQGRADERKKVIKEVLKIIAFEEKWLSDAIHTNYVIYARNIDTAFDGMKGKIEKLKERGNE